MCDKVVCKKVVCEKVVCEKVVCEKVVRDKVVCDKVVCDRVVCEDAEADAEAEPRRNRPGGADPKTRAPHNFVKKFVSQNKTCHYDNLCVLLGVLGLMSEKLGGGLGPRLM